MKMEAIHSSETSMSSTELHDITKQQIVIFIEALFRAMSHIKDMNQHREILKL
jgi:hypothetical protein